jgi:hypothetical protein
MSREVWGTCAVNDHLRREPFLRELLLFDRLVIPYPADDEERNRWRDPNPADPAETWDPERLDELLDVLGTQHRPGQGGARLTWTSPWSSERWQAGKTRREVADTITTLDAFSGTRAVLAMGEDLPGVIEAVATYPSRQAWWEETRPLPDRPPTAATALITLARPLLLPQLDDLDADTALLELVELASDADYRHARTAYHGWLRDFVAPLQDEGRGLNEIVVDEASYRLAKEKLDDLLADEQRLIRAGGRAKRWTVTEWAMIVVGTGAQVGLALLNPLAALGAMGPVAQFAGWVAGKRAQTPEPRPLNGASMFVTAEKALSKQ